MAVPGFLGQSIIQAYPASPRNRISARHSNSFSRGAPSFTRFAFRSTPAYRSSQSVQSYLLLMYLAAYLLRKFLSDQYLTGTTSRYVAIQNPIPPQGLRGFFPGCREASLSGAAEYKETNYEHTGKASRGLASFSHFGNF